jgi:hypothetical protein
MNSPQPKKRVRGKSIRTQLTAALAEAADAQSSGLGCDHLKLLQTRIIALSKLLRVADARKLRLELEAVRAEKEQLKSELARVTAGHQSPVALEIQQALAKYRG